MNRILILDGDHKNTLAIVRNLGQTKAYTIDITFYKKKSVCFFSKYASNKHIVHNPKLNPNKFISDLLNILKSESYLVVMPVSYISFQLCAKYKKEILKHTHITVASYENINLASSKIETYYLAEKLGIPYPPINVLSTAEAVENLHVAYPCVIKAPIELGKNLVKYAYSKEELVTQYTEMASTFEFKGVLPIVQEFIIGEGVGFFAYYEKGKCINYFMHKRLREYPLSGGASVLAEGFYNEQILKDGKKILDELQWEGIAMVEFKKDNKTGTYNLMEINAKFWGSLDLAFACGANFPQLLIDNALEKKIEKWEYSKKRFQWILNGDLFTVLEHPLYFVAFVTELFRSQNDLWIKDILPNIFQLLNIPVHYYKKWFK